MKKADTQPSRTTTGAGLLLAGLAAVIIFGLVIVSIAKRKSVSNNTARSTLNPVAPTIASQISQAIPTPSSQGDPRSSSDQLTQSAQATQKAHATPTPLSQAGFPLSSDQLTQSAQATRYTQATQNFIATDLAYRQIIAVTATYVNSLIHTPVPGPTGIYDDEYVKASLQQLGFDDYGNGWAGIVTGYEVSVFAGAPRDDPTQGMVYVFWQLPVQYPSIDNTYPTPSRAGSVRIVAERHNRLTLVSVDQTIFYFDVPSLRYVDSLVEVVPTFTLPTVTPTQP
jgi:hypothetical protein